MARKTRQIGTRQSQFNKRRKGLLAVIIPWMRRFGVALAVFTGVLWLGSWLVLSGSLARASDWAQDKIIWATADAGFTVQNILVEGRQYTDPAVLMAIVNLQKGDPLFSFNPQDAQGLIAQIGWVDKVQVERRLPDTIYIGLTERKPMALWQTDKRLKLLDRHGQVIVTGNLQRFADLVMLSGADAPEHAQELIGNLAAEPEIYGRIESARRIGQRRWDLRTKSGIEVQLPEEDMGLALRRLSTAQQEDGLLEKDILSIDMREPDRISIRTKPGTVQEYQADLKIEAKSGNNI